MVMSTISGKSSRPSDVSGSSAWMKGFVLAALLRGAEELAHRPVPVHHPVDARELVPLAELLQGRLQHPQVAVVVDV